MILYHVYKLYFLKLTVITMDKRRSQLTFKASLLEMGEYILVDFRLSKVSILSPNTFKKCLYKRGWYVFFVEPNFLFLIPDSPQYNNYAI